MRGKRSPDTDMEESEACCIARLAHTEEMHDKKRQMSLEDFSKTLTAPEARRQNVRHGIVWFQLYFEVHGLLQVGF